MREEQSGVPSGTAMELLALKVSERITSLVASSGLKAVLREDNPNVWDETLRTLAYAPVLYSRASMDYQLAYRRSDGGEWLDCSLILYHDNRACAIWPLSLSIHGAAASLTSHGHPVMPPLFVKDFPDTARKTLVKAALNFSNRLSSVHAISRWESAESYTGDSRFGLSDWHKQLMSRGAAVAVRHELFVDLSLELAAIKSCFRKSYKSLITSGARLWRVEVMARANPPIWSQFQELHAQVAGRITRSAESWERQHQAIADGSAFLVALHRGDGALVGGGFFQITRDEGLYAVGAYDRSLFDKPLGHVVQYRAIEEMKRLGLRSYKIGRRPYPTELPKPTQKEIAIGEFMAGLATHHLPQFVFTMDAAQ